MRAPILGLALLGVVLPLYAQQPNTPTASMTIDGINGPTWPIMLPLNILDELVRPASLALRLFGNMLAGTVMVSVLTLLPPAVSWAPTAVWEVFDLFIGLLQALIHRGDRLTHLLNVDTYRG